MKNEHEDQERPFLEHEKAAIREELRVFMRANPARAPLSLRFLDSLEHAIYSPRLQFATAVLALISVAGSGTAFAAQSALPGEPLYGIKINVEEPIIGSFATSPEARANWNAQLAATRLSEAEQLAAQNKLTPAAAATVAGGLNQATENFDANVAQLATSTSNAATVASLASSMEATLAANTQVMTEIENVIPATTPALAPILSNVQERTDSLNTARTQYDIAATQSDQTQAKAAAEAELAAAQGQVNTIQLNSQATSSANPAVSQAAQAVAELASGQQSLAQGNYIGAIETFQAASVDAQAAQLNASIGAQLGASAGIVLPIATSSAAFTAVVATTTATSASPMIPPQATTTSGTYHHASHSQSNF